MEEYAEFNQEAFDKWLVDSGDQTHRLNYNLNENSIVFDLGGYRGEWAGKIFERYKCNIHVFEPVHRFCENIRRRFVNNPKIKCYEFGLGPKDENLSISLTQDSSSVYNAEGDKENIVLKSFTDFLNTETIGSVDLLKINIEGGEYDVLEDLIAKDKLGVFKNIQVQFHRFVPDCIERRNQIREALSKTHELTYDYEFVWENWTLKE